jgi:hypothetical protein
MSIKRVSYRAGIFCCYLGSHLSFISCLFLLHCKISLSFASSVEPEHSSSHFSLPGFFVEDFSRSMFLIYFCHISHLIFGLQDRSIPSVASTVATI